MLPREHKRENPMLRSRTILRFIVAFMALYFAVLPAGRLLAQDASTATPMLRLYIDPKTKVVYAEPGRGRRLLTEIPASALSAGALEQRQEKTEAQIEQNQQQIQDLVGQNHRLEASNFALTQ